MFFLLYTARLEIGLRPTVSFPIVLFVLLVHLHIQSPFSAKALNDHIDVAAAMLS